MSKEVDVVGYGEFADDAALAAYKPHELNVEASGRIMPDTAAAVAATGVDLISVGRITHSAPVLDIGLDIEAAR